MKKNYEVLMNDVDVQPMIDALLVNQAFWSDIPNARLVVCRDVPNETLEGAWYTAATTLPLATYLYTLMNDTMSERVGRINIVDVLQKELIIVPDNTPRSRYYQEFVLILYAGDETTIQFGDEEIKPETGDLILYDNTNPVRIKANG